MKKCLISLVALSFVVGFVGMAAGVDIGEMQYVFQFPDGMTPTIDGDISDWDIVPELYWIHEENMVQDEGIEFDPSDHNMKFAWGWNDTENRIYFATWIYDDSYMESGEYFSIYVDASHSKLGPDAIYVTSPDEEKERWFWALANKYYFLRPEKGTTMYSYNTTDPDWDCMPPYGDHGLQFLDGALGSNGPSTVTAEMMVTPWEDLNSQSGETAAESLPKSKILDLTENELIGIELAKSDTDVDEDRDYRTVFAAGYYADNAGLWGDWLLSPLEEGLAVESATWGRIKSSFAK